MSNHIHRIICRCFLSVIFKYTYHTLKLSLHYGRLLNIFWREFYFYFEITLCNSIWYKVRIIVRDYMFVTLWSIFLNSWQQTHKRPTPIVRTQTAVWVFHALVISSFLVYPFPWARNKSFFLLHPYGADIFFAFLFRPLDVFIFLPRTILFLIQCCKKLDAHYKSRSSHPPNL